MANYKLPISSNIDVDLDEIDQELSWLPQIPRGSLVPSQFVIQNQSIYKPAVYLKYSKIDMAYAIRDVLSGTISALQASRKYGVPSRTLYDKVRKIRSQFALMK